ncbi:MAG: hypothetical protein NTX80_00260 [Candidatus Saccharibacteria bacterium]|nr:hypothetical protein [Candidatus Saccharibacteria bacterium]
MSQESSSSNPGSFSNFYFENGLFASGMTKDEAVSKYSEAANSHREALASQNNMDTDALHYGTRLPLVEIEPIVSARPVGDPAVSREIHS